MLRTTTVSRPDCASDTKINTFNTRAFNCSRTIRQSTYWLLSNVHARLAFSAVFLHSVRHTMITVYSSLEVTVWGVIYGNLQIECFSLHYITTVVFRLLQHLYGVCCTRARTRACVCLFREMRDDADWFACSRASAEAVMTSFIRSVA